MRRENEARSEAAEVLRINPKFSLDYHAKLIGANEDYINALREAGLK